MSSSMNAWVERHATTARLACASSRPSAFRRWVLPSPLFPTSTSGLYFLPGRSSTARTALTATSLDGPTAYPLSGKAPDGPGGGATPPAPWWPPPPPPSDARDRETRSRPPPAGRAARPRPRAPAAVRRRRRTRQSPRRPPPARRARAGPRDDVCGSPPPPSAAPPPRPARATLPPPCPRSRSRRPGKRRTRRRAPRLPDPPPPAPPPPPPPPTPPHTPAAYTGPCRGGYGRTEQLLRRRGVDGLVIHRLERHQPVERAHQLAHVGELESRHGVEHARLEPRPPLLGLAAQDRDASLVVGQSHVHHQAAREAGDQALVQVRDLGRRPVAREYDLVPRALERLREPQQLGLHLLAVREELHVVHQQHVHVLEPAAERVALPRGDRRVERLHVFIQRQVLDVQGGGGLLGGVTDGHEQMRLPEAGAAIDEERVVRRARGFGHGAPRGDGEAV